ncbi:50S ribosomal protein L9 [Sphingomonas sp.]|uniref:50S ribosomal protein L9 n=1 Tax=Sphingomonas sp. TaxID=28214 RepID=UPI002DD663A4|nr:50S ribosomal protein L9 [Sphingomonas sp.]
MTNVILLQPLRRRGTVSQVGDVIEVRPGHARNFLIPTNRAIRATAENLKQFERRRSVIEDADRRRSKRAQELASTLDGLTLPIVMAATSMGSLYGSVSPKLIAREARGLGLAFEPSDVVMVQPIRTVGVHQVIVRLHPGVEAELRVAVGQSRDEIARLGLDGSTTEERQDRALRLLDSMAAHVASGDIDDLTEDLLSVAALADEQTGLAAHAAIRNNAGPEFETIVRGALESLDVDCLVGVDATVDLHDRRVIHFRARLLGALPARVGDLKAVRLVAPEAIARSSLELSLYSSGSVDFSDQFRTELSTSGRLDGIELGQTATLFDHRDEEGLARDIWVLATLNGECVHRRVWSF